MPTAIVTGATGILGRAIVKDLANHSEWSQIHALSRSKKDSYPSNVVHNHVDLQASAQDLAKQLADVKADYLFFAAYLAADDEQKHADINGPMLKNFLEALAITGATKQLKRVILVCGAKQYGLQFGPVKIPMEESDPRIDAPSRPPNFYYIQQDILYAESRKQGWSWTVTYPNDVQGFAKGNFMNLVSTLGLYAVVFRELSGSSAALEFPGSEAFYSMLDCYTDADLHADFCRWAATSPTAANQAFNVVNGDVCAWQSFWPRLAKRFGMTVAPDMFTKPAPTSSTMALADKPPIADNAGTYGLVDRTPAGKVEQRIDLVNWAQRPDVKDAWKRLAAREGLDEGAFDSASWGFLGFVLGRSYNIVISGNKARKAGYTGWTDSWDSFEKFFAQLEADNVLPKRS